MTNTQPVAPREPDRTVVYAVAGGRELALDLFLPASRTGLRPGIVFVHGGGWRGGHRGQLHWHAGQAAEAGFVAASISYRLSDVATYPAALDDCQRAVRWLRAHAEELSLDPDRLGAFGSSAGAHLAAFLGVRDTRDDSDPGLAGLSSRVRCVVAVHGVFDFPALPGHASCEHFLGGTLEEAPDAWADASPIRFVDERTAPMLLTHAPDDPVVPFEQSVRMAGALVAAARPMEFLPTPGSGHGFVYKATNAWTPRVWGPALAWLKRFLDV